MTFTSNSTVSNRTLSLFLYLSADEVGCCTFTTRFLLAPSLLLEQGPEAAKELIATLTAPATNLGTCVNIVAGHVEDVTPLCKKKKCVADHETALVEYIEEYHSNNSLLADAMEEDITAEDHLGPLFVNMLKSIWRLKALGFEGLMDGLEEVTTTQIKEYVKKLLEYAENNSVQDTYCARGSEVLAEACVTFNESSILLDLREQVATQITSARIKGIQVAWRLKLTNFLTKKTKEALDELVAQMPLMQGIKDDKPSTIQTAVIVLCESALAAFPKSSAFGDNVPEAMLQLCDQFLADHVRQMCLGLNMLLASTCFVGP